MIQESEFQGHIDVVLARRPIKRRCKPSKHASHLINHPHKCRYAYTDYEADLAIGAAGSSVWGASAWIPQIVMQTADNQKNIYGVSKDLEIGTSVDCFLGYKSNCLLSKVPLLSMVLVLIVCL